MIYAKVAVGAVGVLIFLLGALPLAWIFDGLVVHRARLVGEDQVAIPSLAAFCLLLLAIGCGLMWIALRKMPLSESRRPDIFD